MVPLPHVHLSLYSIRTVIHPSAFKTPGISALNSVTDQNWLLNYHIRQFLMSQLSTNL